MANPSSQKPDDSGAPPFIRALLSDPDCYGHAVSNVQLVETHISWVLLTGEFAYKIKKPVDLGFLDFSTLELRRQACNDELRLNRRLAPELYLGVVTITGRPQFPHIGGTGEAFEYAVKMVQFPLDVTLDQVAARGELGDQHIDALAVRLAHFHQRECEVASENSPWGTTEAIAHPVQENFELLAKVHGGDAELLARLRDWCDAELLRLTPLMRERKSRGMVRECHGDLHLANLAWHNDELVIFDCIEFDPALRWIDVISEVAFCFMDLLQKNLSGLAYRFLNTWLEACGDYEGIALLRYYAVYRALVRAKVAALRTGQGGDEVRGYLHLADSIASPGTPQLWITHGLSGSGKTTVSQALLQQHGMIRVRSDVERKRMAGLDALARSADGAGQGLYAQEATRNTYARLASLADSLLDAGWPVIVDAAFLQREQRDLFRALALRHAMPFRIADVSADINTLLQRVALRTAQGRDASDAGPAILEHQLATAQPLQADELCFTTGV